MIEPIKRERIEVLNNVAPEELGQVIADFADSGAKVTPHIQPSGSYQVEAVFERTIKTEPANKPFFKMRE
jgi:hypothetical protein